MRYDSSAEDRHSFPTMHSSMPTSRNTHSPSSAIRTTRRVRHTSQRRFVRLRRAVGNPIRCWSVTRRFSISPTNPPLAGTDGVVVARSLTKLFGLPGLRTGFAVATGTVRDALATLRRPWNLGTPALAVGTHCLNQDEFIAETQERVNEERPRMREALATAFAVHPSDAPFLLLDVGARDPATVVANARKRGVAVRNATTFRELDSHVRVAVRLPEENDRLLEVLCDS